MIHLNNKISCNSDNHLTYEQLRFFLLHLHDYSHKEQNTIKRHLAVCRPCWDTWNKVRWDAAESSLGLLELEEYLKDGFKKYFDSSWAIADSWNEQNPVTDDEIANFYRNNDLYLYNLIIWHESGQRYRLRKEFKRLKDQFSLKTAIDYGCGVGTDTLELLDLGFEVTDIDYSCPSIDFLKWRLKKRGLQTKFIDVDEAKALPNADFFIAIDVLEHIPNPLKVVQSLIKTNNKIFAHISQFNNSDSAGQRHPLHFNFNEVKLNNLLRNHDYYPQKSENLTVWVRK